ncbi:MAG: polyprenyl synthetase family protein [Pseudomonadota bacterium]
MQALVADDLSAVNVLIRERMASDAAPLIPTLAAHLIEAGGKRLRPILTLAAARLCDYRGEDHVRLAATVEFIHTATLLHDDVVDESALRRGRDTANILYGNKPSVLVGDFLFSRAFQLMVETNSIRVLGILSNAAAVIAEGEVLQLSIQNALATDEATYLRMIRGKTAALFEAATQVGGVIAAAPSAQEAALAAYGDALGVAFQLVDDALDYGGAEARLGKTVGDDFREGKVTLPILLAHAAGDAEERAFWTRCIEKRRQDEGDLAAAIALMTRRGALAETVARARAQADAARAALEVFPESPMRQALEDVADFVVARLA